MNPDVNLRSDCVVCCVSHQNNCEQQTDDIPLHVWFTATLQSNMTWIYCNRRLGLNQYTMCSLDLECFCGISTPDQ